MNDRAPMHLVDDDVLKVVGRDNGLKVPVQVRVRVWRAEGRPAVVLVSEVEGKGKPIMATCKIADRVWRDILHYNPRGMHYYEQEDGTLWEVQFTGVGGTSHRQHLTLPKHTYRRYFKLDELVGQTILGSDESLAA